MKRIYILLSLVIGLPVHAMTSQAARLAALGASRRGMATMSRQQAARVLGVAANATPAQAREAYVRQANQWHPDVAARQGIDPRVAGEGMKEINEAWSAFRFPDEGNVDSARQEGLGVQGSPGQQQTSSGGGWERGWSGGGSAGSQGNPFEWLNPKNSAFWGVVFQLAAASWIAQGAYKQYSRDKTEQDALQAARDAKDAERIIAGRKAEEARIERLKLIDGVLAGNDYSLLVEKNPDALSFPVKTILQEGAGLNDTCIKYQINYLKRRMLELDWRKDVVGKTRVSNAISQLTRYLKGESAQSIMQNPAKSVPAARTLYDDIKDKAHPKQYEEERKAVALALEQPQRIWYGSQAAYEDALAEWTTIYEGLWARYVGEIMGRQEMMHTGLVDNNQIQPLCASYLERELLLEATLDAKKLEKCLENSSPALDWVLVRAVSQLTATQEGKEQFFAELAAHPEVIAPTEKALRDALQRYDLFMRTHPKAPRSAGFERARAALRTIESGKNLYNRWWQWQAWAPKISINPSEVYYGWVNTSKPKSEGTAQQLLSTALQASNK